MANNVNRKSSLTKKAAALGLSAAAALSAGWLIIPWEGEVKNSKGQHVAYLDAVGIPTACWGRTGKDLYGKVIQKGMTYSEEECLIMLEDSVRSAENAVDRYTKVPFASTFQKASLISFTYNVGNGAYAGSTLLKDLNAGDHDKTCERLLDWKYANKKVLPGLVKRRGEEKQWCLGNVPYEAVVSFSEIVDLVKETYILHNPETAKPE